MSPFIKCTTRVSASVNIEVASTLIYYSLLCFFLLSSVIYSVYINFPVEYVGHNLLKLRRLLQILGIIATEKNSNRCAVWSVTWLLVTVFLIIFFFMKPTCLINKTMENRNENVYSPVRPVNNTAYDVFYIVYEHFRAIVIVISFPFKSVFYFRIIQKRRNHVPVRKRLTYTTQLTKIFLFYF